MVMKTPEEYFADGREWLVKAERIAKEYEDEETFDTSANLAVLAMALRLAHLRPAAQSLVLTLHGFI